MGLLLVLTDVHNPINNPTVQIADPGKQNILLLRNYTTNRRAISHSDGDVCSYHHGTPFQQYVPRGIMVGALFFSDLPNITRLISLHFVPTTLLFAFNNCI